MPELIRKIDEEEHSNFILKHMISPKDMLVLGSSIEILRDLKEKMERLNLKISELERKIDERMPEKVLAEGKFLREIEDGDDIVSQIISEVRKLTQPIVHPGKEELTIVERRKIEKIAALLKEHQKLSSTQLAQLMNLSRTRSNEYFKHMEKIGLVEGILTGKEKYYRLRD